MRRIKVMIFSWDLIVAFLATAISFCYLPEYISMSFALSFYNVAMTVLSIIFSLFFTAMAILISSSDNDFIEFLEEKKVFTELLWSFKLTLFVLFLSLILSILLYVGTSYWIETFNKDIWLQNRKLLLILEFLFLYGMLATWFCIMDTLQFSKYRSRYLSQKNEKKE